MEARFSLDPIVRLIAALSRDLKEDFAPLVFLSKLFILFLGHSRCCCTLLPSTGCQLVSSSPDNGGQKDAETIEQIFTSWSEIIENLRFCFSRDIQGALRSTSELKYYPSDIINEKISRSMSCVLDLARPSQLEKGIKMMLLEVAEQPERAPRAGFHHYYMIVRLQKS